jgi:hypothetical protein
MLETEIKKIRIALERIAEDLEKVVVWLPLASTDGKLNVYRDDPKESPEGPPSAMQTPTNPQTEEVEPEGADEKVIQLIQLSKEMGYPHLYNNDQLVVDNRVLEEFRRRHEHGSNDPDPTEP